MTTEDRLEHTRAKFAEITADLPVATLTGSEKQVSWANDIRAAAIVECHTMWTRDLAADPDEDPANMATRIAALLNVPDAKWWIDRQGGSEEGFWRVAGRLPAP